MSFKYVAVANAFVPKKGETYRFIGVPASKHGNISLLIGRRVWAGSEADNSRLSKNNVFKTIDGAKAFRGKLVSLLQQTQKDLAPKPVVPTTIYQGGRSYRLVG